MTDYTHAPKVGLNKLIDCSGADCPLCKAGFKLEKKLVVKDIKTGKKYTLSASLSEKIQKIMDKNKTRTT